jgi:hypothetical protein
LFTKALSINLHALAKQSRGPAEDTDEPKSADDGVLRGEIRRFQRAGRDGSLLAMTMAIGESRRAQADQLMWQIPALSLTAQAFLSTIIFSPRATAVARLLAALTASLFVGAAFQSLLKHRYDEGIWSRWLNIFETHTDRPRTNDGPRREAIAGTDSRNPPDLPRLLYSFPFYLLRFEVKGWQPFGHSAFRFWALTLGLVLALDLILSGMAIISLLGIWSPFTPAAPDATCELFRQSLPGVRLPLCVQGAPNLFASSP